MFWTLSLFAQFGFLIILSTAIFMPDFENTETIDNSQIKLNYQEKEDELA